MKSNSDKFYLSLYRQGIDDQVPEIREALSRAKDDPELHAFHTEEAAFNKRVKQALSSEIPVPPDLQTLILKKASAVSSGKKMIPFPLWTKVAALIVLSGTIILSLYSPHSGESPLLSGTSDIASASIGTFGAFETFANHFLKGEHPHAPSMGQNTIDNLEGVRKFLQSQDYPEPQLVINPIKVAENFNCLAINNGAQKVSVINFSEKASGIRCHLFVATLSEFPEFEKNKKVEILEYPNSSAVVWSCSQRIYLMIADAPKEQLEVVMH